MARNLDLDLAARFASQVIAPVFFAEFFFPEQTLRFWSGVGIMEWGEDENGDPIQWIGGGNLVGLSPYNEKQAIEAQGMQYFLNGIPSNLLATAMLAQYQGRRCNLYMGSMSIDGLLVQEDGFAILLEGSGGALELEDAFLIAPTLVFAGIMDVIRFTDDATKASLTMNAESVLIVLTNKYPRRFTDEDQKLRYPGDKGLEYVAGLPDKEVLWGGK